MTYRISHEGTLFPAKFDTLTEAAGNALFTAGDIGITGRTVDVYRGDDCLAKIHQGGTTEIQPAASDTDAELILAVVTRILNA